VASSGIAALLLPGGRTAHSRFRIPIDIFADSSCNVKKNTKIAQLLRRADLIIWDEVPMQHRHCFEAVDRTLRDIRENDVLFGGIPTLFGGDFAQILPVVRRGKRPQIVEACLQRSPIWPQLSLRCLTENMRVAGLDRENRDFVSWLQDLSYDPAFQGFIAPPPSINTTSAIADFYTGVYPDDLLRNAAMDPTVFADRCILSALNKGVNDINRIMIRKYPGELKEFHAVTTAEDAENAPPLPPELLQELDFPSIPPANLELKIGAPVILLRNMDPEHGLCNGTRMTIVRIARNVLETRILTGEFAGQKRLIPRIKLNSAQEDFAYIISRIQFPLRLCFSMTINKSQGQSFERVGVDLRAPPFSHGQFYVAMSRVTDVRRLSILTLPPDAGNRDNKILKNIVYPEVLIRENRH
jgi:hypothetical protein